MLWEIDLHPREGLPDRDAAGVIADAAALGFGENLAMASARGFLVEGPALDQAAADRLARELFSDPVVEDFVAATVTDAQLVAPPKTWKAAAGPQVVHVLLKPGVMDPVAQSAEAAARDFGLKIDAIRTLRKYWIAGAAADAIAKLG